LERLKERLAIARQTLRTLSEILSEPKTSIVRDAAIQRFEYTFEAVWKAAQLYLRSVESLDAGSPKAAIRASRQAGLLSDEQARSALEMADDRNLTVHTYNEALADRIYLAIHGYAPLLDAWVSAMERHRELF
jgi:nucleotidyltransferase substrate binding protein (TIGR01987 family)